MTTQTVRWHPRDEPIPAGWRAAGEAPGHHQKYSVLIEEVPAVADYKYPLLIYAVQRSVGDPVALRVVEYEGDTKIEREWTMHPDKAVTLGLDLMRFGWNAKLVGAP